MTHPKNSDALALYRLHFPAFAEKSFETLHPGRKLHDAWYIEAICHALSRVEEGKCRRLMINIPPRTLKSIIVSVAWPAFLLGHDPTKQIMVISHNEALATELSNKFRQIVDASWYKATFPTMSVKPAKDSERTFVTAEGGKRAAGSVKGSVTGSGTDITILDDPLDVAELATDTACAKVNGWIDLSLSTRFNDPASGPMVLVMQRLSLNDTAAHLSRQERWEKLALPAVSEADMDIPIAVNKSYRFSKGDLLDPVRLPLEFLEAQRAKMGSEGYLAQYQQSPVPGGGGMVDLGLFPRFTKLPKPFDSRFLSIDAASGEQSGSYSVIQLYQVTDGQLYMVDSQRGYWSFPKLRNLTIDLQRQHSVDFIAVEWAHSGQALLEELWENYPPQLRRPLIQKRTSRHSKEDRMAKALVLAEQGSVLLPTEADWLPEFTDEIQAFPAGLHDDQADAFSQAILFFKDYLTSRHNPNHKGGGRVIGRSALRP